MSNLKEEIIQLLKQKATEGAGGGKSGGSGGSESPDTLVTNETIQILHAIGEGEVNLYTGDGQSIFLNNVPLENSDGSYNFGAWNQTDNEDVLYTGGGKTYWEWRSGTPSQTVMNNPAFPSASQIYSVDAEVLGGTTVPDLPPAPVVYEVAEATTDYCLIDIQFPNGIVNVDGQGNIVGDTVEFTLSVKPRTSGSWTLVNDIVINTKSDNEADVQYQLNNPNPGSLWDIQVDRITQDNSSATRKNQMYLNTVEEVDQVDLAYPYIALCGLGIDAATIGGTDASIPTMSFLVSSGPIPIYNNYDPATNTFTGEWDFETFTTGVTDDPALWLANILTNTQYGMGLWGITSAMIDWPSFYNASVFNNTFVSNGNGGTEPRFTFNAPIQNRQEVFDALQQVANMMNANLSVINGLITLCQDRPVDSMYLINKSRVVAQDGGSQGYQGQNSGGGTVSEVQNAIYFNYTSNLLTDRTTVANVTWVNPSNIQWLPTTTSVSDATNLAKYGYNSTDLTCFGATSYGQARRAGLYWLYENLYNTEQVTFDMGLEGFICQVEDVFDLFDDDYAATAVGGRIKGATTNTVTLDQAVTIASGVTSYLYLLELDGETYNKYTITNTPGTYVDISVSGTLSPVPAQYTLYGVVSSIQPRQFKIKDIKIDATTQTASITAKLYSNTNYDYVEGDWTQPSGVYSEPQQLAPTAPTSLMATPTQYINPQNNQLQYGVSISWTRPAAQNISYVVSYRVNNGNYTTTAPFVSNNYVLEPIVDGTYYFLVYSVNILGQQSQPATISYTLDTSGGGTSPTLSEITDLEITGTTGDVWTGLDCNFSFTNPAANQGLLKDFLVTISTTSGAQLRQVAVDPVVGGDAQSFIYTYTMNQADSAALSLSGPQRSIVVLVQGMDSQNDLTTGITATFTNPSPAVPSNITSNPGPTSCNISWTPETQTDLSGYMLWSSTTSGFTPSSSNGIDLGDVALAALLNLTAGDTYYYVVAAYDVFGKSLSGTGMNLSSQLSFTVPTDVGIPAGPTFPSSGTDGEFFYNTSNDTLYQYNGTAWVQIGMTYGSSLPASGNTNDLFYDTSNNTVYVWSGSAWGPAYNGASIQAASIGTSQLTAGSVTTAILAAGSVETSNLAAGAVTAATIAAGTITGSNIAATTISSSNLDVATLSAISANVGTLTGGTISNNSGTNVLNLSATGSSAFISTPQLTITAAGNATFSGALSAATGTFAGSLSAATGSFAGSLSAATGTFAGSLSAASGSFTGSLSGASGTFSGSLTAQTITASNILHGAVSSASNYSAYTSGSPVGLEVASGSSGTLWSQSFAGAYTTMIVARVNFYAGTSSMDCQANLLIDGTVYDTAYFKVYGSGSTPYNTSVSLNCYFSDSSGGSHTVEVLVYNNNSGGLNFWYSMPNATILRLLN